MLSNSLSLSFSLFLLSARISSCACAHFTSLLLAGAIFICSGADRISLSLAFSLELNCSYCLLVYLLKQATTTTTTHGVIFKCASNHKQRHAIYKCCLCFACVWNVDGNEGENINILISNQWLRAWAAANHLVQVMKPWPSCSHIALLKHTFCHQSANGARSSKNYSSTKGSRLLSQSERNRKNGVSFCCCCCCCLVSIILTKSFFSCLDVRLCLSSSLIESTTSWIDWRGLFGSSWKKLNNNIEHWVVLACFLRRHNDDKTHSTKQKVKTNTNLNMVFFLTINFCLKKLL